MSRKTRRTIIVLAALSSLALPLAAQALPHHQERQDRQQTRVERLINRIWEQVKAPFSVFLDDAASNVPPAPPSASGATTDGRSILDPIG